jgi:hypothetical protein
MSRRAALTVLMAVLAFGGLLSRPAQADEPLSPAQRHQVASPNGRIVAISDPQTGTRIVEAATGKELWSMPGWYRWLFVSNDGRHVATGYNGMNLIPQDFTPELVLITFWRDGEKLREVAVRDLAPNKSSLKRTVSHYHWGSIEGLNNNDELLVTRADGRKFRFKMATGDRQ